MVEPRRAFVCGHPIGHSRSPLIHNFWLKEHGIEGSYERRDVTPEAFPAFLREFSRYYAGGNVTIPHKESAWNLVERRDEAAQAIGAVNTLWLENGRLCGGNTDAYGFAANLDANAPGWPDVGVATVIGAGGAARAVIYALLKRGLRRIRIVNRTEQRARDLAEVFGSGATAHPWEKRNELLESTGLLVNTSSLGMAGTPALDIELEALPGQAIVTDIVYVPLQTPLLAAAAARGLVTADGLGMLLHQAVPGFERWFGVRPEVTSALRDMVVADLEKSQ
ncbi:shikimate dehydrogenase [Chelativorans sp. Marseille-P2723]|uniref:shikimate dehydrogenase n=1 Tax=Chelativorans sp. Marseille-P2723 TaxID=2709133 RepID=UPI00156FFAA1|nr:shikimate dehydrogenase [Chelativorans sp. Marseille-P2723]